MYGLPADTVRKKFRTRIIRENSLNPVYGDEPFVFKKVVLPELASVRIAAYEENGKFLGHRVLPVIGLCPGYRHLTLRNELGQPIPLATLFLCIVVKDYVPDGLSDFAEALANPIKYQSDLEKRSQQLAVLQEDMEPSEDDGTGNCKHHLNCACCANKLKIFSIKVQQLPRLRRKSSRQKRCQAVQSTAQASPRPIRSTRSFQSIRALPTTTWLVAAAIQPPINCQLLSPSRRPLCRAFSPT